jgi:hypothetical protein
MTRPAKPWTLTGAARAARDARVAAIRYMRTSPVEQEWQAMILARLHESRTAAAGGPGAARSLVFSIMGYPPPYPATWPQASTRILSDEAHYLFQADLYVLTPPMLAVVTAAAQTLCYTDLIQLRGDDLPGPTGLLVLSQPLRLRSPAGAVQEVQAYTWREPWRFPLPGGWGFAGSELPAVRMSAYTSARRVNADFRREVRRLRVTLPPILLDSIWALSLHPATVAQQHDQQRLETHLHRLNARYREDISSQADDSEITAEYAPGTVIGDDEDGTFGSRFMYAFRRICEQRIATIAKADSRGPTQKTAPRARPPADVRVVALRRAASSAESSRPPGQAQWHHRWVVRMHKVNQWYPSLGQHRVLFRGRYLKGPADKPLLSGDIVKGLVR